MDFSSKYDKLISSELNEEKCQMYATEAVTEKEYEHIWPKAERTSRPWSLGFALPAKTGGTAVLQCQNRVEKANATANKAGALPHDIRERVLRTVHPTQYSYGREYCKISQKEIKSVQIKLEAAMWGNNRRGRSAQIMWTVCYRGHAILPLNVATTRSVRLLFTISTKCHDKVKQDYVELWNGSSSKHENPVSVAQQLFSQQNWEWIEPFKIKIPTFEGEKVAVINEMPWPETMHLVREGMRHRLISEEQLHMRHDLRGLRDGIDFAKTLQNLSNKKRPS